MGNSVCGHFDEKRTVLNLATFTFDCFSPLYRRARASQTAGSSGNPCHATVLRRSVDRNPRASRSGGWTGCRNACGNLFPQRITVIRTRHGATFVDKCSALWAIGLFRRPRIVVCVIPTSRHKGCAASWFRRTRSLLQSSRFANFTQHKRNRIADDTGPRRTAYWFRRSSSLLQTSTLTDFTRHRRNRFADVPASPMVVPLPRDQRWICIHFIVAALR